MKVKSVNPFGFTDLPSHSTWQLPLRLSQHIFARYNHWSLCFFPSTVASCSSMSSWKIPESSIRSRILKSISMRNSGKCLAPGACDPSDANSCDLRKRERCMPAPRQQQVAPTVMGNSDETYKNRKKKESGEEPTYATRAPIQHTYATSPDYTCQCTPGEKRHPVTGVCLRNECLRKEDNDCDRNAQCIDTDESYYCVCLPGFLDSSPDKV